MGANSISKESKESSNINATSNVEVNQLRQRNTAINNSQNNINNPVSTAQNIPNPWEMMYSQSQNQNQATMMQQMYANYMTQYIQYLQSVGAMYQMPSANTQDVVDHPNQITDEARAALGVGAEAPQAQVLNHVAAAAMAGAMAHGGAGGLPQQEQPHQPAAAPVAAANPGVDVAAAVADAPVADNNNFIMNAGAGGIGKNLKKCLTA